MSIASEITRLQNAKAALKTSINAKTDSSHQIDDETLDEYSDFVDSIQTGGGGGIVEPEEKDVNFYDYDGTRVYSYSKADFLALNSLPENPTHDGLTAQGWNWSLADAKEFVTDTGEINIGQMYVTDDGATRIYIELQKGRLSPYLRFSINGTATVDWGDNTTDSVTGTSLSTYIDTQHNYSQEGKYVISISSTPKIKLTGSSSFGSSILWTTINSTSSPNRAYQSAIKKVELGNNIYNSFESYVFAHLKQLKTVTIPSHVTSIGTYCFSNSYNLKYVVLPYKLNSVANYSFEQTRSLMGVSIGRESTVTNMELKNYCFSGSNIPKIIIPNQGAIINSSALRDCASLVKVVLANNMMTLKSNCFYNCYSLSTFIFSKRISTIEASSFSGCYGIALYDFRNVTAVPSLANSNAFSGIASDAQIVVPDDLYETWIAATNWSSLASKIIKESDFNA